MKFKGTITEVNANGMPLRVFVEYFDNPDSAYFWLMEQERQLKYFINSVVLMDDNND